MLKEYKFVVEIEGRRKVLRTMSKHLQGAIRKVYQDNTFDTIIKIVY